MNIQERAVDDSLLARLKPIASADPSALPAFFEPLEPEARRRLEEIAAAHAPARDLLAIVGAGSPFLSALVRRSPETLVRSLSETPEAVLDATVRQLATDACLITDEDEMAAALRRTRSDMALLIALADIGGVWSCDEVTGALTTLADACISAAAGFLLHDAYRQGKLTRIDPEYAGTDQGWIILGMGKLGARELNFSSDIDLIVLFDPDIAPLDPSVEPQKFYVRLTKRLAALLQDITPDGYAFRVDLRLRPDPRATQVAINVEAASNYYESMGQNWERAAMIKARPVAGDLEQGREFLARLKPYVWRKYLDFAAIADVQSLKRQIHAVKGHGSIAVIGHNIKLGRGGIREIEFFVQTQQLIAGGRNPELRGRRTLGMLSELAAANWITAKAEEELKTAYRFLRTIEHRLQMVNDEQTQTLPDTQEEFDRFARFCGYADPAELADALTTTFATVQGHYAALFENADALSATGGSLVFTGGEDDPETIVTLERMGFRRASEVSATVRGWHFGRYAATRSSRARELLTELMPALLATLAETADPDQAFVSFDRFLGRLPTGVQLFSLLKSNPKLLGLIAVILGSTPRLATELSTRPKVLDAVLDPGFFDRMPSREEMVHLADVASRGGEMTLEEMMDRSRIIAKEQMFRVGVRILAETVSAADAGEAYSSIADVMVEQMLQAVRNDMLRRHGTIVGARIAVVAMGKLGGREMTATSDLDLMLIYDHPAGADYSDGPRPLSVNQYFTRLTQHLITALASGTAEGVLYPVDMRLRPSGNKGPVATHIESFRSYHQGSAWTWEKMALTRARPVAGDRSLMQDTEAAIRAALVASRDDRATREDIVGMRRLMVSELGTRGMWDLKQARGGLVEVEFIAQGLQILNAARDPTVLDRNTVGALTRLRDAGVLDRYDHDALREAATLYQRLTQVLRLAIDEAFVPQNAPEGLRRLVAQAAATPDFATAEALVAETQEKVAAHFDRLIGLL
ncbi:MAG: bifunctional [glutamine synthetase] adenylyltransferase/[glutamine synthetase]-adenylyl-L-tyrosine phosphorylase [Hyphomicrobiales bacterium]